MADAALERTVRFRATHHYRRAGWSEAQNREAFGAVADPHSHDYAVTVVVRGPIDPSGFVVDLAALDRLLADDLGPLQGADLNQAIPGLEDGTLQPSSEALARRLWERLESRIPGTARLIMVRVAESANLAAQYEG